jgi:acyl carrier protein
MTNIEKYNKSFREAFDIPENELETSEYQNTKGWDSVGHMLLISILEKEFNIMMETDDLVDLSSYKKGKDILLKYSITM